MDSANRIDVVTVGLALIFLGMTVVGFVAAIEQSSWSRTGLIVLVIALELSGLIVLLRASDRDTRPEPPWRDPTAG